MPIDYALLRRILVLIAGLLYWAGVVVQIVRVRRRTGHTPNVRPRGLKERLLWLGWMAVILGWIIQPLLMGKWWQTWLFRPAAGLDLAATLLGTALVIIGQAATYACYAAMGSAWRMGVKQNEKTDLITGGPYRFIRHPIYGFQLLILIGAALLLPTPFSLLLLTIHYLCALLKTLDEERHLHKCHGGAYDDYCRRTGRFLPRLPR